MRLSEEWLVAGATDPPYLDQYDHDYIQKMYKDINNPKKPEETIPEPDEFIQGELDLASERINPDTILLPFIPKEPTTDDSYGDPHGTPEEIDELMKKGWAGNIDMGSFDLDPAAHKKVKRGAKMYNKTRGNPSKEEVEMIQNMLPGPRLPLAQNKRDPLQELRDGLIDKDTFEKLKITSPELFRDKEDKGPVDISDWLVQSNPPIIGERDAVIQKADELRKAGKTDEALDLYRHAATLPTPTV